MKVAVGPLVASVAGDEALLGRQGWLGTFRIDDSAPADFTFEASYGALPRPAPLASAASHSWVDRERNVARLELGEADVTFDFEARHVDVLLCKPQSRALEGAMARAAQVFGLASGKALHVHASAVERNGFGYVFLGRSGAGKSTAALLSRDAASAHILQEDLVAIGDFTAGGPLSVHTSPMVEKNGLPVKPAVVPLRGFYWLIQSDEDGVDRIARARQVGHLWVTASVGIRERRFMLAAMELAEQATRCVPVKELRFRPTAEFWRAIDRDFTLDEPSSRTVVRPGP